MFHLSRFNSTPFHRSISSLPISLHPLSNRIERDRRFTTHLCVRIFEPIEFLFLWKFFFPIPKREREWNFGIKLTALIRPDISLKKKKKRGEKYAKFSNESRDQKTLADVDLFLHARQISLTAGFPVFFIPSRGTGKSR